MDENLKGPLERLAEALHRAIEGSDDVEAAMAAIRAEGFQAYLLLEVTVALGSAADEGSAELQMGFSESASGEGWIVEVEPADAAADAPLSSLAPDDREFLKSIRIRLD